MAIGITAGNGIERTSDLLDYNGPYTWMGWFMYTSAANYGTALMLWAGSYHNQDTIQRSGTTGNYTLEVWTGGGGVGSGAVPIPLNTWQHIAMVRESTTSCKAYFDGVLGMTHTGNVGARTAITGMRTGVTSVNWDGRAYAMKAWNLALTAEQVAAEMHTVQPRHWLLDVYGYWPMLPGASERLLDFSGRNRPWSTLGTISDAEAPGIPWGGPIYVIQTPAAAPPQTVEAGVLTIPLTLPARTLAPGALTRSAAPLTIPLVQPARTTGSVIVRTANPLVINLSQPAPQAQKGALTRSANALALPLTLPARTRTGTLTRTASPLILPLAQPDPTVQKGALTRTATALTIPLLPQAATSTGGSGLGFTIPPLTFNLVQPARGIVTEQFLTANALQIQLTLPTRTTTKGAISRTANALPVPLLLPTRTTVKGPITRSASALAIPLVVAPASTGIPALVRNANTLVIPLTLPIRTTVKGPSTRVANALQIQLRPMPSSTGIPPLVRTANVLTIPLALPARILTRGPLTRTAGVLTVPLGLPARTLTRGPVLRTATPLVVHLHVVPGIITGGGPLPAGAEGAVYLGVALVDEAVLLVDEIGVAQLTVTPQGTITLRVARIDGVG